MGAEFKEPPAVSPGDVGEEPAFDRTAGIADGAAQTMTESNRTYNAEIPIALSQTLLGHLLIIFHPRIGAFELAFGNLV